MLNSPMHSRPWSGQIQDVNSSEMPKRTYSGNFKTLYTHVPLFLYKNSSKLLPLTSTLLVQCCVLCVGLLHGVFCVTRPLNRSWRRDVGGADAPGSSHLLSHIKNTISICSVVARDYNSSSDAKKCQDPLIGPSSWLPSPPRSLQKVHLVEAGPSRQSLTLNMSEQRSRTTPKASLAPWQHQGPSTPLQDLLGLRLM
jgi:hypothetical protein